MRERPAGGRVGDAGKVCRAKVQAIVILNLKSSTSNGSSSPYPARVAKMVPRAKMATAATSALRATSLPLKTRNPILVGLHAASLARWSLPLDHADLMIRKENLFPLYAT